MAYNNDKTWSEEKKAVLKDSAFNRAVTGVRNTQVGMPALPAAGSRPNGTQTGMQAISASQLIKGQNFQSGMPANATQSRMQAMSAAQPPAFPRNAAGDPRTDEQNTLSMFSQLSQPAPAPVPLTQEQIEERAFYDKSTSTYNFNFLVRMLEREIKRAKHFHRPLSILIVHAPGLTQAKAQFGLLPYSLALTSVSQSLLKACGPIDMVGKYGDERFLFVCPEKSITQATEFGEHICAVFALLTIPCQYPIKIPASVGIATFSAEFSNIESLVAVADLGADLVTARGGNGVCYAPNEVG